MTLQASGKAPSYAPGHNKPVDPGPVNVEMAISDAAVLCQGLLTALNVAAVVTLSCDGLAELGLKS